MEEILDRFAIRLIFLIFIAFQLIAYKYLHHFLYPDGKRQIKSVFNPFINPANTLHFMARVLGIAIVFSAIEFNSAHSLIVAITHILVWSTINSILFLISLYIIESIILYKFDYVDEILKRQNMSYAILSFFISLSLSLLIKQIILESENSLIILIILWLYSLLILGGTSKLFPFFSKFSFNHQLIQKSDGLAMSYSGFLLGNTLLITLAFDQDHYDIISYSIRVLLKILLCAIVMPIFYKSLQVIFKIKTTKKNIDPTMQIHNHNLLGWGILEGSLYLTAAALTSIIAYQVNFGGIVPY